MPFGSRRHSSYPRNAGMVFMSKVNELLFKIRANGSPAQVVLDATMEERGERKTDSACVRGLTWMFLLIFWRKSWDVGSCHGPGLEAALLGSVSLSPWKHQEQQAWIAKAFPWLFLHSSYVRDRNPWLSPHSSSLGAAKISFACTTETSQAISGYSTLTILKSAGTTWRGKYLAGGALQKRLKFSCMQRFFFFNFKLMYSTLKWQLFFCCPDDLKFQLTSFKILDKMVFWPKDQLIQNISIISWFVINGNVIAF